MFRQPVSENSVFFKDSEASECDPSLITMCWYGALAGGSGRSGCGFYQKGCASRPLSSFGKLCCVACINRPLIVEPPYLDWIVYRRLLLIQNIPLSCTWGGSPEMQLHWLDP